MMGLMFWLIVVGFIGCILLTINCCGTGAKTEEEEDDNKEIEDDEDKLEGLISENDKEK